MQGLWPLAAVFVAAACLVHPPPPAFAQPAAEPRPVTPRGELATAERVTIDIFRRARASVVFISTRQRVRDFWTRNVFSVPRGTGSGFLWDRDGHVVTNHHVIEGASEAEVRRNDGRSFRASLVGVSPAHDLAVLRIEVAEELPAPIPLGTSSDLEVGQTVLAIGNPFGLDYTLTTGVVSALDRSLGGDDGVTIEHLIQTDAAINPGNSGGPLLDSAGRLIGINTAIFSPSGAYAGIGFAVPVDTVNRVVPQLIGYGRYLRPSLGISVDAELNGIITGRMGIEGVLVLRVMPGSPAESAGLRGTVIDRFGGVVPGDVIVAIDDREVTRVAELYSALDERRVGDEVTLRVNRAGREFELEVTLEAER